MRGAWPAAAPCASVVISLLPPGGPGRQADGDILEKGPGKAPPPQTPRPNCRPKTHADQAPGPGWSRASRVPHAHTSPPPRAPVPSRRPPARPQLWCTPRTRSVSAVWARPASLSPHKRNRPWHARLCPPVSGEGAAVPAGPGRGARGVFGERLGCGNGSGPGNNPPGRCPIPGAWAMSAHGAAQSVMERRGARGRGGSQRSCKRGKRRPGEEGLGPSTWGRSQAARRPFRLRVL